VYTYGIFSDTSLLNFRKANRGAGGGGWPLRRGGGEISPPPKRFIEANFTKTNKILASKNACLDI